MTTVPITRGHEVARYAGGRINQLLWERRLTKTAGAESIDVTPSTFSKKLRGEVPITVDELLALAQLLEVQPGELMPPVEWAPRGSNPEPAVWKETGSDQHECEWVLAA